MMNNTHGDEVKKGRLIVISGPSGVGKGTVVRCLLKENKRLCLSVSATTRKPRKEDTEGVTYFFKDVDDFKKMVDDERFLEWAVYNGNYYGTPIDAVEKNLSDGMNVILEIDVQGAVKVMDKCPNGLFIFIAPPCTEELKNRLIGRGSESPDEIERRVAAAESELKLKDKYDHVVINKVLADTVAKINDIIMRET